MDRRVAGTLVIVSVLLAALMGSSAIRVGTPGSAARQPAPVAPAVGSCVVHDAGGRLRTIPCDRPHEAEIGYAWTAGQTAAGIGHSFEICQEAGLRYLGLEQGWEVPTVTDDRWSSAQVRFYLRNGFGPTSTLIPGWSWQACMLNPMVPDVDRTGYTGTLKAAAAGQISPALRSCYLRHSYVIFEVSCRASHLGEALANRVVQYVGTRTIDGNRDADAARLAECRAIAARMTGNSDPTYGGRLAVVVNLRLVGGTLLSTGATKAAQERIRSTFSYVASCALESVGASALVDSVIGLGHRPVPLR